MGAVRPPYTSAVLLGAGIALRVLGYLADRSYRLDEARVVLNVATRSWWGLTRPLDYDQSVPLLFLWAEKLAGVAFGVRELAFRSIPLAAGIALVLVAYPLARRVLSPAAATLAAGLVAASPILVSYASEAKQYSLEALIGALLTLLGLDVVAGSRRARTLLLVAGTVAVWAAAPAVFVLAAVWLAPLRAGWPPAERRRWLGLSAVCWGGSFALAYLAVYRGSAANPYLEYYWQPTFLRPGGPEFLKHLSAVVTQTVSGLYLGTAAPPDGSFASPAQLALTALWLALAVAGVAGVARTHSRATVLVLLGPLAVATAASAAGRYPLYLRLLLFAAPSLYVLLARGVEVVLGRARSTARRALWGAAALVLLGPPAWTATRQAITTHPPEHLRPLARELAARRAGESVYVFAGSLPPWAVYTTDWEHPDTVRLALIARLGSGRGPSFENAPARTGPVANAGGDLAYDTPAGRELYGLSTGIEWRPMFGVVKRTTDPGWAANEAWRIAAAASPGIWVVMSHTVGDERDLIRELVHRGGRVAYQAAGNDAFLDRIVFDSAAGGFPATLGRSRIAPSTGR